MRFICDSMLGKLTRYLRILGIDTEYCRSNDFEYKLLLAKGSGGVFLTRNTSILLRKERPAFQFIKSNFPWYQLFEVIESQKIDVNNLKILSRCLRCNTLLEPVNKIHTRTRVPEYVYNTQDSFSICTRCNCFYWKGTHYERLKKFIESIQKAVKKEE